MSGRYKVRCAEAGVYVYDEEMGRDGTIGDDVAGPMSWDSATRHAALLNSKYSTPEAPRCDCPAERYRHALAQIGRYSPCSIAQGYVDEALFASARAKGETS